MLKLLVVLIVHSRRQLGQIERGYQGAKAYLATPYSKIPLVRSAKGSGGSEIYSQALTRSYLLSSLRVTRLLAFFGPKVAASLWKSAWSSTRGVGEKEAHHAIPSLFISISP